MNVTIVRDRLTARSSTGTLSIDGVFECFTLEDAVRPVKIKGLTAIPYGAYELIISWSARFGRQLPLLLDVPHFDGIRIHAGNTDADTDGCILVGQTRETDRIGQSKAAFSALFAKLEAAAKKEKIFVNIAMPGMAATGAPLDGVANAAPGALMQSPRRVFTNN
jgi:hypothetical protein